MSALFLTAILGLLLGPNVLQEIPVPDAIGSLKVYRTITGSEARKFLDQLHNKTVAPAASVRAEYRLRDKEAVLYISKYKSEREASEAGSRMMNLLKMGNRVFRHYAEEKHGHLLVGRCVGLGQVHYVYQSGVMVYWLSADPSLETEAVEHFVLLSRPANQ